MPIEDFTEETLIFQADGPGRGLLRTTWEAFSTYLSTQTAQQKPVTIPQFGKLTFLVKNSKPTEPVFIFSEAFLSARGLRARSVPRGALVPQSTDLNYTVLSVIASQPKDATVDAMKQLMRGIGKAMMDTADNKELRVRVNIEGVGKVCCNQGMCKFAFAPQWGCTRPGTNETCRTSFSRSSRASLASRAGSVLGGTEGRLSTSREMNAAMKNAVSAPRTASRGSGGGAGPAPRKGYGDSELATIEELRSADEAAGGAAAPEAAATTMPEDGAGPVPGTSSSNLINSVMDNEKWNDTGFGEGDVDALLGEQGQTQLTNASDVSATSDVLPVYLCPEMTRSSRRIQRQKAIVAKALQNAYARYDGTLQQDLQRVSKENQLFEAELRRQTQAANELRAWRRSNLMEQRKTHEVQMAANRVKQRKEHADMTAPVKGYIDSRLYVDDGRQKILGPHQKMLHKTIQSQQETKRIMSEESKREMIEYEQLQNELLMKDMELRQSYVREAGMNEGATLRSAWQQQLKCKRKVDVVKKVNDDIITNCDTSWLPEI